MPAVKLTDFLKGIFTKAGLDMNAPSVKQVLDSSADIELDNEEADKVNKALMTRDVAKTLLEPEFRNTFLGKLDSNVATMLDTSGFDQAAIDDIKGTKDSYEKAKKLFHYSGEHGKKAGKQTGDQNADVETSRKKINELNEAHAKALADKDAEIKKLNDQNETDFVSRKQSSVFATWNLAIPTGSSLEEEVDVFMYKYNKYLAPLGRKLVKTAEGTDLKMVDAKTGADAVDPATNTVINWRSDAQTFGATKGALANSDRADKKDGKPFQTIIGGGGTPDPGAAYANQVQAELMAQAAKTAR